MKTLLALGLLASLAACGSSTPAAEAPQKEAGDHHAEQGHDHDKHEHADGKHEHKFKLESMTTFHDVLSPLWHSEPGDERTQKTCAALGDMTAKAEAIAKDTAPEGVDAAAFTAAGEGLYASLADLETVCTQEGRLGDFDRTFKDVHDAFHAVMDVTK